MDTDSFIINIKVKYFYEVIVNDVEERFGTSNYDVNRPLPKRNNKKVIGLIKDELGGRIMTEFAALILTKWMMVRMIKKQKEQRSLKKNT